MKKKYEHYKQLQSYELNEENPYIYELQPVKIRRRDVMVASSPRIILNTDTGESEGHFAAMKTLELDQQQFIKFYMDGIAAMCGLSKRAFSVLHYIVKQLKPNQDYFYFDLEECKKETGYKGKTTIISGMSELIENKFIARTTKHYKYFINPAMFFNGNRVSFIKTAVLKSSNIAKISNDTKS
jgi:hypothetical protein